MFYSSKPVILLTAGAFAIMSCTSFEGSATPRANEGAAIGAIMGAILGAGAKGNKTGNVIIGAALGAVVGGVIGQELDRQEAALRASMGNENILITNTGSKLVVTLPEAVTFDTGSDFLRDTLRGDLQALAHNLNEFPNTTVDIIGHTDNIGTAGSNQDLSARRAESVAIILLDGGVDANRLRSFGRGEDEPKASNLSAEGRAANRRVEIIIRPVGSG